MAKQYDLVIIGAGPAGYTAALKAAEYGISTVVIEEKKLGGNCVNRGCIPVSYTHLPYRSYGNPEAVRAS